jgi:outer membrane protein OmpA-like peptidoglycan-associated protein
MRKTALLFAIAATLGVGPAANASDFIYRSPGYQLKKPVASPNEGYVVAATAPAGFITPYGVAPVIHVYPQPLLAGPVARQMQVNAHFEFDRSELRSTYEERLDAVANIADRLNPRYGMGRYGYLIGGSIVGHTDSIGSRSYNQALSERRALAAEQHLRSRGVDTGRMAVYGMGLDQPIADNSTDAGRALNRRTEVNMQLITTPDF